MKFLFLFMDGVGLGVDDPEINPFASADMPHLHQLLGGKPMVRDTAPSETHRATLLALDPNLGVERRPQSATGQAALVTGKNVPALIGEHYGPKPNPPVRAILQEGSIFSSLAAMGYSTALLNAYPEQYFAGIESGRRIYSAIPMAVTNAGVELKTHLDLENGKALSVDFTGEGWRERLGYDTAPVYSSEEAGKLLAKLTISYDFAFFEFWPSDFVGHRQDQEAAHQLLEGFDKVLGGLLDAWDDEAGLILITSDHGNMEDLSTRRHTYNPVPGLVIGSAELRQRFTAGLEDLTHVAPAILRMYE